jgi:hypothetical protein
MLMRGGREPNDDDEEPRRGEGQESNGSLARLTAVEWVRLLGRSKALESQGSARRRIGLRGFENRGRSVKALGNDALSAVAPLIASVRSASFATAAVDVLARVELAEDHRHRATPRAQGTDETRSLTRANSDSRRLPGTAREQRTSRDVTAGRVE